jgi:hypothetical protein
MEPFTTLLITAGAPVLKTLIVSAFVYFSSKPIINKWGDTPINRFRNQGFDLEDLAELKRQRKRFNDLKFDKIQERDEKISRLEETCQQLNRQLIDSDPNKKAIICAQLEEVRSQISLLVKENKRDENSLKEAWDTIGSVRSQQQFENMGNSAFFGSTFNRLVYGMLIILSIMFLFFVQGIFNKIKKKF